MKILFAAPDRDLLECFKQLFETDLGETVTAFDGTQVMTLLSAEDFDVLIIDRKIPRVDYKVIIELANSKKVPAIVLTDEPAGARRTDDPLPYRRMSYPFTFDGIRKTVIDTLEKGRTEERTESVSEDV